MSITPPWYDISLAILGILSMILIPIILWACLYSAERRVKQAEATAIAELEKGLQEELASFRRQHPEQMESYHLPPSYELDELNQKWNHKISESKRNLEKQKGRREPVSCCRILSATWYISSCIWALFIVFYVPLKMSSNDLFVLFIVAAILLGIGVIFVCFESICSRERYYLKNLDNAEAIDVRLAMLQNTPPSISIHAVAYHYETRTRTVWETDSHGHRHCRTETYKEKVITGRFNEAFLYHNWKDESALTIMDDISQNQVTRITMELVVKFGDALTEIAFNQQYDLFKDKHRNKDTHVDFSESRTVAGFESHLAAYTDLNEKPWWIRERYYCIASLLFLTWPYRVMFNRVTAKTSYSLVKSVQCENIDTGNFFMIPGSISDPYQLAGALGEVI